MRETNMGRNSVSSVQKNTNINLQQTTSSGLIEKLQKFEQRCNQILEPSNQNQLFHLVTKTHLNTLGCNGSFSPPRYSQEVPFEDKQIYARRQQVIASPTFNNISKLPNSIRQPQSLWVQQQQGQQGIGGNQTKKGAIERQSSLTYIQKLQQNHARIQNQQQLQLESTLFKQPGFQESLLGTDFPFSSCPAKMSNNMGASLKDGRQQTEVMKQQFTILNVDKKGSQERPGIPIIKLRENNLIGSTIQPNPVQNSGRGGNYYYQSIHKKQLTGGTRIVKINKKRREMKPSNLFCGESFISIDFKRQQLSGICKEGDDGMMYRVWNDRNELQDNEEVGQVVRQSHQNKKVNVQYLMSQNQYKTVCEDCYEESLQPVITSIALVPKNLETQGNNNNNLNNMNTINNFNNYNMYSNYEKILGDGGNSPAEKVIFSEQRIGTDYNTSNYNHSKVQQQVYQQQQQQMHQQYQQQYQNQQQFRLLRAKDDLDKESVKKLVCLFSQQNQRPLSSSAQWKHEDELDNINDDLNNNINEKQPKSLVTDVSQPNQMSQSSYQVEKNNLFSNLSNSTNFNSLSTSNLSNQLRYMNQMSKIQHLQQFKQQNQQLHSSVSSATIQKSEENKKIPTCNQVLIEVSSSKMIINKNTPRVNLLTSNISNSPNFSNTHTNNGISTAQSRPSSHKEMKELGKEQDINSSNTVTTKTKPKPTLNRQATQNQQQQQLIPQQPTQQLQKLPLQQQQPQSTTITTKGLQQQQKQDMFRDFLNIINFSNNMISPVNTSNQTPAVYKVYIGLGNNGIIVRQIFKTRWWWQLTEDKNEWPDCQFLWMQWRRKEYTKFMKSLAQLSNDKIIAPKQIGEREPSKKKTAIEQSRKKGDSYQKLTKKLLNEKDIEIIDSYLLAQKKPFSPPLISKNYCCEKFCDEQKSYKTIIKLKEPSNYKLHNHVQGNFHICNKKALFYNMRAYYQAMEQDPFEFIPLTFHIREGTNDKEWERFVEYYTQTEQQIIENEKQKNKIVVRNIWIIKPGETTNRGNGIQVAQEKKMIQDIVSTKEQHSNGKSKTFIIQKYLDKPLLYKQRKFDIRCYMLITTYNGIIKGYWYQDGYIRTSSKEFSLRNLDNKFIHLTNDAIQKKGEEFGKFEIGNKLSYNEFQRYMDTQTAASQIKYNFQEMTYQDMKKVATDCVKAIFKKLEPQKKQFSFELFGLDFMIDENYKTWLIEVNTNPCLETTCPLLARVITGLLENVFKVVVDPIFPPPSFPKSRKHLVPENIFESNRFELIFDELIDASKLEHLPDKVDEVQEEDWEEEEMVEQQLLAEDDQDE